MTLLERVMMARVQLRIGPNRVGLWGLLQPIADGIKLVNKERFQPAGVARSPTGWPRAFRFLSPSSSLSLFLSDAL